MKISDAGRLVARCAPGASVRVLARGTELALPVVAPEAAPQPAPTPVERATTALLERDAETREHVGTALQAVAQVATRVDEAVAVMKDSVARVAEGQATVVQTVAKIENTLAMPVRPVFDKQGKLKGAERVKKLED